jgi:cobaltochelatase CobS
MTLRTMLNLERAYELEMKRETGMKDEFGKTYRKMPNGKTLKDALESYFIAMNREKAEHIKTEVNLEGFLNSYKGSVMKAEFIKEFKRRIG